MQPEKDVNYINSYRWSERIPSTNMLVSERSPKLLQRFRYYASLLLAFPFGFLTRRWTFACLLAFVYLLADHRDYKMVGSNWGLFLKHRQSWESWGRGGMHHFWSLQILSLNSSKKNWLQFLQFSISMHVDYTITEIEASLVFWYEGLGVSSAHALRSIFSLISTVFLINLNLIRTWKCSYLQFGHKSCIVKLIKHQWTEFIHLISSLQTRFRTTRKIREFDKNIRLNERE